MAIAVPSWRHRINGGRLLANSDKIGRLYQWLRVSFVLPILLVAAHFQAVTWTPHLDIVRQNMKATSSRAMGSRRTLDGPLRAQ